MELVKVFLVSYKPEIQPICIILRAGGLNFNILGRQTTGAFFICNAGVHCR